MNHQPNNSKELTNDFEISLVSYKLIDEEFLQIQINVTGAKDARTLDVEAEMSVPMMPAQITCATWRNPDQDALPFIVRNYERISPILSAAAKECAELFVK